MRVPIEPNADYNWALSPDGAQMALLRKEWTGCQVQLFRVGKDEKRTLQVKGAVNCNSLDWASDSRSMFIGSSRGNGSSLMRLGTDGTVQSLWFQPQLSSTWGIPSPDGRHIAMLGDSSDANVWVIDNF
jgi:Tol biopolymer transport system component